MKQSTIILFLLLSFSSFSQTMTGRELLEKAISYHDPNNQWSTFKGTLHVNMQTPNRPTRKSRIKIDLPQEYFYLSAKRDTLHTEYTIEKDKCTFALNGNSQLTTVQQRKFNVNCDRAALYKNYYTYLYGLPMKLKDPGAIIDDRVIRKSFKGKTYLVLKVTYDAKVGKDTWYFYFNPESYAMEIYQFYKDESKKDGEYIILKGLEEINGIKMPKKRAWYYNKNDGYLGTDILMQH